MPDAPTTPAQDKERRTPSLAPLFQIFPRETVQPGCTTHLLTYYSSLKREVERHLSGRDTEAWELLYFKLYKSHLPVIERALEIAGLMLGNDKPRGYCLEMICADFLAGANMDAGNSDALVFPMCRVYKLAPRTPTKVPGRNPGKAMSKLRPRQPRVRLEPEAYEDLRKEILARDNWRCQNCGAVENLQVHHIQSRSRLGDDTFENLITLCARCHEALHRNRKSHHVRDTPSSSWNFSCPSCRVYRNPRVALSSD